MSPASLRKIGGLPQGDRIEQLIRLVVISGQRSRGGRQVGVLECPLVERIEQLLPTAHPLGRFVRLAREVAQRIRLRDRVDEKLQRIVGRTEKSAPLALAVDDVVKHERQSRVRRDARLLPPHVAHARPVAGKVLRPDDGLFAIAVRPLPAGQHFRRGRVVQAVRVMHAADKGHLVHHAGHVRQMLGNGQPGTDVEIVKNSPRISLGACGLGSNVSRWLGPP